MFRLLSRATTLATVTAVGCAIASTALFASSHREAPHITELPKVDGTDFYIFRSYEAGREDFVTLIANYQPLQDSYGGPNYFQMDPNALYEIHIDNNADALEDITFQFRFQSFYRGATIPTGPEDNTLLIGVPLVNVGLNGNVDPVGPGVDDTDGLNVIESYRVTVVRGDRRSSANPTAVRNVSPLTNDNSGTLFRKPVDNIGERTIPNYPAYAQNHVFDIDLSTALPGCTTNGRVFAGQRREGFVVNLGDIFDRLNFDPLGARNSAGNILDDKNITSLALEIPTSCLLQATAEPEPVLGAWTTASLRQARVLNPRPEIPNQVDGELNAPAVEGGAWTQVSRVGSPLVNEVVIGLNDKDLFNASEPPLDAAQFGLFISNPTLPVLVEALFSVPAPPTPRTDLGATFLTGVAGLNQPANLAGNGEMLRLNTSIEPTAAGEQSDLGFLGCDLAGFPNGRRPIDDVVDISLTVVEGAIIGDDPDTADVDESNPNSLQTCNVSTTPRQVVNRDAVVNDGAQPNAGDYLSNFPYLSNPLPGATGGSASAQ